MYNFVFIIGNKMQFRNSKLFEMFVETTNNLHNFTNNCETL